MRAVAGAGLSTSHHWESERGSLLAATFSVQVSSMYDEFHCLPFCSTILGMWLTKNPVVTYVKNYGFQDMQLLIQVETSFFKNHKSKVIPVDESGCVNGWYLQFSSGKSI